MVKIGLLSDTHAFLDDRIFEYFSDRDEIWHAGDIGNVETAQALESFKPFRAVWGNIDGYDLRLRYKKEIRFLCEEVDVYITHIGGYPGKYEKHLFPMLTDNPPQLLICGHSHILKVIYDKKFKLLYLNPGAAGISGFHKVKTLLRFEITGTEIKNMEIIELGKR